MKKIILALFLLFPISSFSQKLFKVDVECYSRKDLALLLTDYEEVPFAIGSTMRGDEKGVDESFLIIFVNPKTRTWSVVEKSKDNQYCILSAGSDFNLITKATPTNSL